MTFDQEEKQREKKEKGNHPKQEEFLVMS